MRCKSLCSGVEKVTWHALSILQVAITLQWPVRTLPKSPKLRSRSLWCTGTRKFVAAVFFFYRSQTIITKANKTTLISPFIRSICVRERPVVYMTNNRDPLQGIPTWAIDKIGVQERKKIKLSALWMEFELCTEHERVCGFVQLHASLHPLIIFHV